MITKIFFQTSKNSPKTYLVDLIKSRLTDQWRYIHFNDDDVLSFFEKHPIEGLENIVDKFNALSGAHKGDLFRYYFIYCYGGFFMDFDAMIYQNIEDITKDYDFVSVDSSCHPKTIFQGIIGASPKNPLIKKALFTLYETDLIELKNYHHLACAQLYQIIEENKNAFKIKLYNELRPHSNGDLVFDEMKTILFRNFWRLKKIPLRLADIIDLGSFYWKNNRRWIFDPHTKIFTEIYKTNFWKVGSGTGSTLQNTLQYNDLVVDFINSRGIKSVTDLGCGDWQSSFLIYDFLPGIDYLGIDCVKSLILYNTKKFPKYHFRQFNFVKEPDKIRDSDLYILKDVLQHLKLRDIYQILDHLTSRNFKYILITNFANQLEHNEELNHHLGIGRGLNSTFLPLKKYNATPLLDYHADEDKHVCIISKKE